MWGPFVLIRGREGIQTPSLLIRSQTLYSVELRNHLAFLKSDANIHKIRVWQRLLGNFIENLSFPETFPYF